MAVTDNFKQAVINKEIRRVRIMMKDSLLLDPSFKLQQTEQLPLSAKELQIIEDVRRECEAQNSLSKT